MWNGNAEIEVAVGTVTEIKESLLHKNLSESWGTYIHHHTPEERKFILYRAYGVKWSANKNSSPFNSILTYTRVLPSIPDLKSFKFLLLALCLVCSGH